MTHALDEEAMLSTSFVVYFHIPHCIIDINNNEMQ